MCEGFFLFAEIDVISNHLKERKGIPMAQGSTQAALESAERARAWVSSDEGRKQIEELLRRAKEARRRLAKARRINPKRLHQPVTL